MVNQRQLGGMISSIQTGKRLQIDHPEIAEMYRDGLSRRSIADRLNVGDEYSVTTTTAEMSVHYALTGYDGNYDLHESSFKGIIPDDERGEIAKKHRKDAASSIGSYCVEHGVGIHGMTQEQRDEMLIRRGIKPAVLGEQEFIFESSSNPDYFHDETHNSRGKPSYQKIADATNQKFHNGESVRNKGYVANIIQRERKKMKKLEELETSV